MRLTGKALWNRIYPVYLLLLQVLEGKVMAKTSLIEQLEKMDPARKAMLNRLKRVEGQLRGIQRMIIEDKPCQDILLQLSAARKAMQNACIEILKSYVKRCLAESRSPDMNELETLIGTLIDIAPVSPSSDIEP
jgi:CsoR family transcriptional regulator, copper-sensing transcriptional repressor